MLGTLNLVTAPSALMTAAVAKTWLRVSGSGDDTDISSLLRVMVAMVEDWTGRCLLHTVYDWILPTWPSADDWFPRACLKASSPITHVKYIDVDGVQQTLASDQYQVLGAGAQKAPGRIVPAYDVTWPSHRTQENAVEIRFTAGYHATDSTDSQVPAALVHAVKTLVAQHYDNRTPIISGTIVAELPFALKQALAPWEFRP